MSSFLPTPILKTSPEHMIVACDCGGWLRPFTMQNINPAKRIRKRRCEDCGTTKLIEEKSV